MTHRSDIPPELEAVKARFENVIAPIQTKIARLSETLARTEVGGPSADELEQMATSDGATPEAKAVARAVAEGRTTWEQVAGGQADDLPEMKALHSGALRRFQQAVDEYVQAGTRA